MARRITKPLILSDEEFETLRSALAHAATADYRFARTTKRPELAADARRTAEAYSALGAAICERRVEWISE